MAITLPSVPRIFGQATGIDVSDPADIGMWGDDLSNNRLVVSSPSQLAIDPLYGGSYVFNGPPSISPIQLGFRQGDKIYLRQATGEVAGPNVDRVVTIFDPATLAVMETLVHPDSTPYKFFAVKRGR